MGRLRPAGIRDAILFLGGFGGFVHELLAHGPERPYILLVCVSMMGLPAFLRYDERGSK